MRDFAIEKNGRDFIDEFSVDELRLDSDNVLKRLRDRLATAFGVRR
jgi:hypothetical protein